MFTNRVRAIRNSISNPDNYRTIVSVATDPDRYRAIRKAVTNPHHYPAAVLTIAAVAVGVAPLTASAASAASSTSAAAPAAGAPATPNAATPNAATSTGESTSTPAPAPATTQPPPPAPPAQTVQPAPAAPSSPFAGTNLNQLEPTGTVGGQSSIPLDSDQWANATTIVHTAENLHLSPYAATIAVATSMQESKLQNLTVAVDHDSLGLFQQRPSTGWGSPSQLTDPTYAATAFLNSLPSDYQNMQLDNAAQSVQRSFDGYLYAQWEDQAAHIVYTIVNH